MKKLIIILIICLANFWIWRVFKETFALGVGMILVSIFLTFNRKILTLVTFLVIAIFIWVNTFDTNLKYISPLENNWLVQRQEYYAANLGKLYRNRVGLFFYYKIAPYLYKYQKNLGYNLDPNLYFFSNHPRERGGIIEFDKFPLVYAPIFIIGMIIIISGGFSFLVFYGVVSQIINAFIFPGYNLGPILIFPFLVSAIFLGISKILKIKYEN